jgi:hypothetical protein
VHQAVETHLRQLIDRQASHYAVVAALLIAQFEAAQSEVGLTTALREHGVQIGGGWSSNPLSTTDMAAKLDTSGAPKKLPKW